jgi:hypothetical protein
MASTIKVNSIEAQSSTDINIPTGFKLKVADAGELYIGGTAITTGAQGVISKTATYPIVAADFTGKSSLIVFVDVSAGTNTETIITLPAENVFDTCAIHVVSTATHGAGNKITINNDTPTEMYTLFAKMDHCEIISDGTTAFRTGNEWVTVRGEVALTANYTLGANAVSDLWDVAGAGYSVVEEIGGGWSTSNDDWTAPFAGEFMLAGSVLLDGYGTGFGLKKNGTFIQAINGAQIAYGNPTWGVKPFVLAKDDVITFWIASTNASPIWYGAAAATSKRTTTNWWCLRRY